MSDRPRKSASGAAASPGGPRAPARGGKAARATSGAAPSSAGLPIGVASSRRIFTANEENAPKRRLRAAERRLAILDAALEEFAAKGFAATRLDDVAARAMVAKGTIYLYFKDKDALFQELVRSALVPLVSRLATPPREASARAALEMFIEMFVHDVSTTRRADIIRLVISEGARFPALAEMYYREVVSRGLAGLRAVIEQGIARGEIPNAALSQFPHLVIAPAVMSLIWSELFGRIAPLDARAMLRTQLDLIFGVRSSA